MTQPLNYASGATVRSLRRPKLSIAARVVGLLLFAPGLAIICTVGIMVLLDADDGPNEVVVFWTFAIPFVLTIGFVTWRLQNRPWFNVACAVSGILTIAPGLWIAYDAYNERIWLWEIGVTIGLIIAGIGMGMVISGALGFARRRYCEW